MNCPNCDTEFKRSMVANRYGRLMELNRCSKCGGFWFRRFELYNLTTEQAEELDQKIDFKSRAKKFCPDCHGELFQFQDLNIPPNMHFERCRQCAGVWVPSGELIRYKKSQASHTQVYGFSAPVKSSLAILVTIVFGFFSYLQYLYIKGRFSFSADFNAEPPYYFDLKSLALGTVMVLCYLGAMIFLLTRWRKTGYFLFSFGLFLVLIYVFWMFGPVIY